MAIIFNNLPIVLLGMEGMDDLMVRVFAFLWIVAMLLVSLVAIIVSKVMGRSLKAPVGLMFVHLILLGGYFLFTASHKQTLRYNDWAVLGHNITEVEEKYGPVDRVNHNYACYYIDGECGYWMHFDASGMVDEVAYGYGPWG